MQTRIMIILTIVGIAILWYGSSQMDKFISLIGVSLLLVGIVGAFVSGRNKKGMGFLRRL